MSTLSLMQYRLSLLKDVLFGDQEVDYAVLEWHRDRLADLNVRVSWTRDDDYIVGTITAGDERFHTQGMSAQEFVEMVNDAIYAVYDVPIKYARALGGNYRLMPSKEEFARLNDAAVKKSSMDFVSSKALA